MEWVTDRLGRGARYDALLRAWDRQHLRIRELEETLERQSAEMSATERGDLCGLLVRHPKHPHYMQTLEA